MEIEIGRTKHGQDTVIYRGFEYWKKRENICGTTAWRCREYKRLKCKATIVTSGKRVVGERQPAHSHEGNLSKALARKAVGDMKDKMGELMAAPSAAQAEVASGLDDHILMALPKRSLVTRTLQRQRQRLNATANGGTNLPPLPVDLTFNIPDMYRDMVLFDSGPGQNRIILISCRELLDGLARADVWLADGTFKVVPTLYFQLYSIHFAFGSGINPAALYCLLTNKTGESYTTVLRELKTLIPLAAPRVILVDFERAAINAFNTAYPTATVSGCYFHLSQSVIRKVHEVGLKIQYETDNKVREYVRCLSALAFVPPADVIEAFELLVDTMPDVDHLGEVTTFFEYTYIRGRRQRGRGEIYGQALFATDMWNKHDAGTDGIARTTNSVEGWHHGLQSLFQCQHPTMWTFFRGLKLDIQKQKTTFLHAVSGVEHIATKRYRALESRVQRAVQAYGRSEVLVFLRAMAHLSHS